MNNYAPERIIEINIVWGSPIWDIIEFCFVIKLQKSRSPCMCATETLSGYLGGDSYHSLSILPTVGMYRKQKFNLSVFII